MQVKNTKQGKELRFKVDKRITRVKWIDSAKRLVAIDFRLITKPMTNNGLVRAETKKFPTPEHLRARCDEYFATCHGVLRNSKGEPLRKGDGTYLLGQIKPYTISGLARYLQIKTDHLKKYHLGVYDDPGFDVRNEQFSTVLDDAIQRIEQYVEEQLYSRDSSFGAKFCLSSGFNWNTPKELAEINSLIVQGELKKAEFALKKAMLEAAQDDEGTELKIQIVRASKD